MVYRQTRTPATIGLPPGVTEPEGFTRPKVTLTYTLDDTHTVPGTPMVTITTSDGYTIYQVRLADITGASYPEWWIEDQQYARNESAPLYYVAGTDYQAALEALGVPLEYDSKG